ncbi:MAG TPA: hypothetical protein VMS31_08630, partial [Pyrinomonadaceae bacterium]|nr:hypothetical protein [Pyrinomonadaceae bacterium]
QSAVKPAGPKHRQAGGTKASSSRWDQSAVKPAGSKRRQAGALQSGVKPPPTKAASSRRTPKGLDFQG